MTGIKNIIHKDKTLLEALTQINTLPPDPLVLFVVDDEQHMVGTLTDGDSRRALIAGASLSAKVKDIMHQEFRYLQEDANKDILCIRKLRNERMKLVPVLNKNRKIVGVIDFVKYKSALPIDAILMAGGKGERLRPLTNQIPKPLLPVGNKAIIDYNVDSLILYGVKHVSVTVNYLSEQLERHFSQVRDGVKILTVKEPQYLGTIGSVQFIDKFYNDTILVMNSDLFTNIDFEDFYLHFKEHEADMSVVAVPYSISIPYGIFEIYNHREIRSCTEKPTYNYYANAGIYLIKREMIERYISKGAFLNATDFMERLISENKKVIRYPLNGTWIDIGTPQEYQKAKDLAKHL